MKKNVLFVINSELSNSGVPGVVMQIVRNLHEDYTFDIIAGSTKPGYYDKEFESFGGTIRRLDLIDYASGKLKFVMQGKQIYNAVNDILAQKKYDVIHCHNGYGCGPALKAAFKHKIPIRIAHSHGTYLVRGKNIVSRIYKKNCMRLAIKYSTARLACSEIAGKTLFLNRDFKNILNPINLNLYQNCKVGHDGINLVQIGYYNSLKNQLFSIEVLKNILDYGTKTKMHFIGYDTGVGYLDKLKNKASEYQVSDSIVFLPSDYNKAEIFALSDFLLLPSKSEGLPLVALEAQASGVYCLASDHVSNDVNMGLFKTLPIDKLECAEIWAKWIVDNYGYTNQVNSEKLKNVSVEKYMEQIKAHYNQK